jgi:two-component system cell cycle sensor histidine kinase/response regulator CckA
VNIKLIKQAETAGTAGRPELPHTMSAVERRDWWLWFAAVFISLLLTAAIVSFALPTLHMRWPALNAAPIGDTVLGLVGLVLLFDIYALYQHFQIQGVRKQLIVRDELFRLITENAADMIAVVDADGRRLYNSPSYERILGYTSQDMESATSFDQIHPDDSEKVRKAFTEALRTGAGHSVEYRMRHKDGRWRTLESRASTIFDERGKAARLVTVNRDVTERRSLEEQFRQAQKMEAVGRLSGGVAHDFNNLLGVIIGYGEIVQERVDAANPLRGSIDEILKAAHRAASLTRQLLAFSRQQVLDPKVLDLNAVVKDMEKMLQRLIGEDIELKTELGPALGRIRADQGQIEQVILNLCVNARDAMPDGGKLTLSTSNFYMDEDFTRRYPYPVQVGEYVLFTAGDSGIGMDATTRARIFEPFFTTKEKGKGTGLGLSMVYGVVKQSGGYIEVSSEPGSGAAFKIWLPKVEAAIADQEPVGIPATLQGTETILLVEDEPALRSLARHQLESCGYSVLEAGSGADALELAGKYEGTIHLLFTDVVMPAMNGRALADALLLQRPQLRVVFTSGYTGQTVGAHGVLDEGSFFLPKPFTREGVARKIREALDDRDQDNREKDNREKDNRREDSHDGDGTKATGMAAK